MLTYDHTRRTITRAARLTPHPSQPMRARRMRPQQPRLTPSGPCRPLVDPRAAWPLIAHASRSDEESLEYARYEAGWTQTMSLVRRSQRNHAHCTAALTRLDSAASLVHVSCLTPMCPLTQLVECVDTGQPFVLKVIPLSALSESERLSALGEVETLKRLSRPKSHPFIVRYRESFLQQDALHIVMQHCAGGDLHAHLRARKAIGAYLPEDQILDWLIQLLLALRRCHDSRIIHRDLKTQVTHHRHTIVTDWYMCMRSVAELDSFVSHYFLVVDSRVCRIFFSFRTRLMPQSLEWAKTVRVQTTHLLLRLRRLRSAPTVFD